MQHFAGRLRIAAEDGARYTGGGSDMNYLAYMCSAAILIAVYLATNPLPLDRFCRWFYWGMAVLFRPSRRFSPAPAAGLFAC